MAQRNQYLDARVADDIGAICSICLMCCSAMQLIANISSPSLASTLSSLHKYHPIAISISMNIAAFAFVIAWVESKKKLPLAFGAIGIAIQFLTVMTPLGCCKESDMIQPTGASFVLSKGIYVSILLSLLGNLFLLVGYHVNRRRPSFAKKMQKRVRAASRRK